jgi:hypothetical protein
LSLGDLRALLDAYHEAWVEEELVPRAPVLSPSPGLDRQFVDLFRRETVALLDAAGELDGPARARWRVFVLNGIGRLAAEEPRRELAHLLASPGEGAGEPLGPEDIGEDRQEAAAEAASEAARCAAGIVAEAAAEGSGEPSRLTVRLLEMMDELRRRVEGEARNLSGAVADEGFSAAGFGALWRHVASTGRFLRPGDGRVRPVEAPRPGAFPRRVPDDVVMVAPRHGGVDGYRLFLRAAGEALAWAHLPRRLPVEDLRLPADGGAGIYGRLFARRLLDEAWLEGHGIGGSRGEMVCRQVWTRWREAVLRLTEAAEGGRCDPESHELFGLSRWEPGLAEPVAAACGAGAAAAALDSERVAALLDEFLLTRHGRRWDESPRAAGLLRDLWSEGWGTPVEELLSSLGTTDPEGENLLEQLRR